MPTPSTITLSVTGMSCGSCRRHVEAALRAVPGVATAQVDLGRAEARVVLVETVDTARLVQAVVAAGYQAQLRGAVS